MHGQSRGKIRFGPLQSGAVLLWTISLILLGYLWIVSYGDSVWCLSVYGRKSGEEWCVFEGAVRWTGTLTWECEPPWFYLLERRPRVLPDVDGPVTVELGAAAASIVVIPIGYVVLIRIRRVVVRKRCRSSGCCENCGYDLRGSQSGVCPECGKATPRVGSSTPAGWS